MDHFFDHLISPTHNPLLIGLGDSADGFSEVATSINAALPYVKFIVPTAGKRAVTISGGMAMNAWYDITGLTDRASEDCEGIEDSVCKVRAIIQAEIALGVPSNRIALAGFSQGGAMSLYTGLQLPLDMKPAGVLVMSGYLPGASKFTITPGLEDVPVMHCHGTADPVVIYGHAERTRRHVTEKGVKSYIVRAFDGVGHTVSPEIMQTALNFLTEILPNKPEFAIKPKAARDMTVKELKDAIRKAGLHGQSLGFFEKREFVALLEGYQKSL